MSSLQNCFGLNRLFILNQKGDPRNRAAFLILVEESIYAQLKYLTIRLICIEKNENIEKKAKKLNEIKKNLIFMLTKD